jgi:hypothetical protein
MIYAYITSDYFLEDEALGAQATGVSADLKRRHRHRPAIEAFDREADFVVGVSECKYI